MISGRVAPLARFIMPITSAFLLARSAFGLAAGLLARLAFVAGLAFLDLRGLLVAGASAADVLVFSDSMLILLFSFCRKLVAVVTSHHSGREKHQDKSGRRLRHEAKFDYG
jgi:hypothetical protein